MKIKYTDRTPQVITIHKVQKDWASAIKVLKPFKTGFLTFGCIRTKGQIWTKGHL